ncbi:hypothetical protein ETB97_008444 [Aspergillus alliaceus]|uniref:Uncharacterized protein n=1 Tax=Petromyces alliaceus TaxID=209559 RepID=A0A8H6E231_PETAA|nr:hypothetical protein ETB97_008444 [Aspergillus burnettii]
MSRLKTFHSFQRPSQSLQTNITQTSDKPWEQIGPGKDYLLQELEDLYWAAVKVELENIIRTLKVWQQPEYVDICISDENDNTIHGFDTFLDQVCQESRAFAIRYGETKAEEMVNERSAERFLPRNLSYKEALRRVLLDTRAEYFSKRIREEVRGNLHTTPRLSGVELRAWMLLQNAGFLDIDKLIEHRPPLDKLGFWKRPAIPQHGRPRSLFPLNEEDNHIAYKAGYRCTVLKLSELVPYAKYQGLLNTAKFKRKRKRRLSDIQWISNMVDRSRALRSVTEQSRQGDQHDPVSSKTSGVTEAQANEDIPLFFRQFTEKYPFGNVHMALRVGPLVIENGVSHTKAGALITMRETPVLNDRFTRGAHRRSLAVGGDPERLLWQQERQVGQPKRYKAVMKQIVGAPFTGILSQGHESKQEREIVELMVAASKQPFDNPGLPIMEKQRILDGAMSYILEKLRNLLNSRVKIYLNSIAQHLLDPGNTLTWSATSNNCQNFCNSLIDSELFEPLVNGLHMQSSEAPSPLYLMSFVCPPEGYLNNKVISKFDVPSGLTEEYLLRFHYGRHDEADIIDTLQEYWYDWGAFESPLYKYQDLFPWDCTEAYMRYPTKCGDCNLSKHVWAFPFDSWSIIALHHYRDKHMYQPKLDLDSKGTDSWIKDRLTILTASSILARAATAMAKSATFCKATAWLHSKEKGLRRIDPSLARVKLGGIHRAQPFSHYFEAGTYSHYFLAEWALKKKMDKIRDYETLRDGRARRPDISSRSGGRFLGTSREPSNFDRLFDGFRGMDGTDPDYTGCDDRGQIETDAQFDQQTAAAIAAALIADSQLDCVQNAEHMVAEAAAAAANCGSGCGSVTEPSHVCGSSSSGGGYSSGGGGSSSCGGGSSSCGGGGSSCGGGGGGGGCD